MITQNPPDGYHKTAEFNLKDDFKLALGLNITGFVLLLLAIYLLTLLTNLFHPTAMTGSVSISSENTGGLLVWLGLLLLDVALMVVLHEAVHGLFFWLFTGRRPVFALRPGYAYAAAPGCLLPRGHYVIVGLAPLVILTLIGLALVPLAPVSVLFYLNLFIALNFAGAVGDLWVVVWLWRKSPGLLVRDHGDSIEVFELAPPAG